MLKLSTEASADLHQQFGDDVGATEGEEIVGSAGPPLGLAPVLVMAALATAVASQGGFYLASRVAVELLLAVAAAVFAVREGRLRHLWQPVPVALAVLATWAVVSAVVAGHLSGSLPTISVILGVGAVAVIIGQASAVQRDYVARGVLAIGTLAALSGWVGVAFRISRWASAESGLWRATTTITYTNAAAAVMAPLALLGVARLVARPATAERVAVVLLMVGVASTLSRAGIIGLGLGYLLLAAVLGVRRVVAASGRLVVGAAIAAIGLTTTMSVHSPSRPVWAVLGLAAGLAAALVPMAARRAGALAVVALVLTPVVVLVGWNRVPAVPSAWGERITLSSPSRTAERHAAVTLVRHHLLTGVGPGQALFVWTTPHHELQDHYAHDEYLQLAAEQGLIGVALLAGLIVAIIATARAGRRSNGRDLINRTMWSGAVVGLVYLAGHSALDWLWHIPAVTLVGAILIGFATPIPKPSTMNIDQNQEAA